MNNFIDHTCLRPNATKADIHQLCLEAEQNKFRAVCVAPTYITTARKSTVPIVTVINFPTGAHWWNIVLEEAITSVELGAIELDVVWNLGLFKSGKPLHVMSQLAHLVKEVAPIQVKVIVEEYYLNLHEKKMAWEIIRDSGAWAIKTSTGFGPKGATLATVKFWKSLGDDLKIKAAGGIRTSIQAREFLNAGANIIGTSHGISICC